MPLASWASFVVVPAAIVLGLLWALGLPFAIGKLRHRWRHRRVERKIRRPPALRRRSELVLDRRALIEGVLELGAPEGGAPRAWLRLDEERLPLAGRLVVLDGATLDARASKGAAGRDGLAQRARQDAALTRGTDGVWWLGSRVGARGLRVVGDGERVRLLSWLRETTTRRSIDYRRVDTTTELTLGNGDDVSEIASLLVPPLPPERWSRFSLMELRWYEVIVFLLSGLAGIAHLTVPFFDLGDMRELCRASCVADGRCGVAWVPWTRSGLRCWAVSAQDCERTTACRTVGRCDPREGQCRAGRPESCRDSDVCHESARCSLAADMCVVGPDDCRNHDLCRRRGLCQEREQRCVVASDADCKASERCRDNDECVVDPSQGRCWSPGR